MEISLKYLMIAKDRNSIYTNILCRSITKVFTDRTEILLQMKEYFQDKNHILVYHLDNTL